MRVDEVDHELAATGHAPVRVDVLRRGLSAVDDALEHAGRDRVVDVGDHGDMHRRGVHTDLGGLARRRSAGRRAADQRDRGQRDGDGDDRDGHRSERCTVVSVPEHGSPLDTCGSVGSVTTPAEQVAPPARRSDRSRRRSARGSRPRRGRTRRGRTGVRRSDPSDSAPVVLDRDTRASSASSSPHAA